MLTSRAASTPTIAFLGVGIIGAPMAVNPVETGFNVTVNDPYRPSFHEEVIR
jgi:3-hydroxyisobutyrate dehydrogenase-like beta-hydroxyacid dehydrogenase